jgi:hypothetical protein
MNRKSGEIESHRKHLDFLRRGHDDAAEQIVTSREAIERSLALLRIVENRELQQKPERKPPGRGGRRGAPPPRMCI